MFELRDYQQEAVRLCLEDLRLFSKVGLILPTGSGKTEIFINIAKQWLKDNPQKCVLILSHLSILTTQTVERFKKREPDIRIGTLKFGERPGILDNIIIGTMQSGRKASTNHLIVNRLSKNIGLVIVDEAHYLQTESYNAVIDFYKQAKVLGCTATPYRENKFMTNFFEKISYSLSLQELIDRKYLVPPNLIQIVNRSKNRAEILAMVAKTYIEYEKGKKAIVFLRKIEEAEEMASVFEQSGINAKTITSNVKEDIREQIIKDFNYGDVDVLTTVDVLTAGFDSPTCSCIFQPYATKSVTKYIQRIGRGLRPYPGKTQCNIYVYGEAPKIEERFYQKIQNLALNANGLIQKYQTFKEEWEFNDWNEASEEYVYTSNVIKAIERMKSLGMHELAGMLNNKDMPERFMGKIPLLMERLPTKEFKIPGGDYDATDKQKQFLSGFSFSPEQLSNISKGEANMMIKTIKGPEVTPFTIMSGRFSGYHVSELSSKYKQIILSKFSGSRTADMIRRWEASKKEGIHDT